MDTIIRRVEEKLDTLQNSLPERFVAKYEFQTWRTSVDERIKSIENGIMANREAKTQQDRESLKYFTETLKNLECSLDSKITAVGTKLDKQKESLETAAEAAQEHRWTHWGVLIAAIAGLGTLLVGIGNYVTLHFHP